MDSCISEVEEYSNNSPLEKMMMVDNTRLGRGLPETPDDVRLPGA